MALKGGGEGRVQRALPPELDAQIGLEPNLIETVPKMAIRSGQVTQKMGRGGLPEAQDLRDLAGALGAPQALHLNGSRREKKYRENPLNTASLGLT